MWYGALYNIIYNAITAFDSKQLVSMSCTLMYFVIIVSAFVLLFCKLFFGSYGIGDYIRLSGELLAMEEKIYNLNDSISVLSDRVSRLRSGSIDLDFLEEEIKREYGYTSNGEVMIYVDDLIYNDE